MAALVNIIYEDNHLLVVEKPINMPVQEDRSQDLDLLNYLKEDLKMRYQKPGNVYLGLVHRLDRPVGGVMVFAKTSKAASRLFDQIRQNLWTKQYFAVIQGYLPPQKLEDRLLKDAKTNITRVDRKGKASSLIIRNSLQNKDLSLLDIELITGRSHQIRVQLASRNTPLWGDQRYNKSAKAGEQIALFAGGLKFYHPISKEQLVFELPLPDRFPFIQFEWNY